MNTLAVRISKPDYATLQEMARCEGKPMGAIVSEALRRLQRARLLDGTNAAYGALRKDAAAWAEIEAERAAWDGALADGMRGK